MRLHASDVRGDNIARMSESDHQFGGFWTELKLEAVEEYLKLYTKALAPQGFELWYVDGFAGTGERTEERIEGGLLGQPIELRIEVFAGSAKRALGVRPPFDHFVFIEKLRERCEALEQLKPQHPDTDIRIIRGDANAELRAMVARRPWSTKDRGSARGVVFLDPYAMHVEWSTLLALAGACSTSGTSFPFRPY
jgi:three-Cys-motif partner protein